MKDVKSKTDRTSLIHHLRIKKIGKVSSVGNFNTKYACPVCGKSLEYSPARCHNMGRYTNVVKCVEITCSHCGSELETDIGVLGFVTMRDKVCMPNSGFIRGLFDRASWYTKSEFRKAKKEVMKYKDGYCDAVHDKFALDRSSGVMTDQNKVEYILNFLIPLLVMMIIIYVGYPKVGAECIFAALVMGGLCYFATMLMISIFNIIYDGIISCIARTVIIKK